LKSISRDEEATDVPIFLFPKGGCMRLDPNPLFRRVIMPWYDSPPVCWVSLLAMAILLFFSVTGIVVAENNPDYSRFVFVPIVLLVLSGLMIFSLSSRMIRRSKQQKDE
jgi:ABC-type transport system involved in cytochrome c biogenesis permease subunit